MTKQRNINKALSKYLENLDIESNDRAALKSARTSIREHLRKHFPVAKGKIKFMTQGSFQYQTINRPCYPPRQQMDLDDGIYVPRSCVEVSSKEMLDCLSKSLSSYSSIQNGEWKLKEKPSCVRIIIAQDKHVDIPLYRAPDKEMDDIIASPILSKDSVYEIFGMKYSYDSIKGDCVELAHKDDDWTNSDPRKIFDWFANNVDKYGKNYIHICRILKAWRDHQWPQDKAPLSSILLMKMVEMIFEDEDTGILQNLGKIDNDLLLYTVSKKLASTIRGNVPDPDPTRYKKLNNFTEDELQLCIDRFDQLRNTLYSVLYEQSAPDFLDKLCKEFGRFFPKDSGLCKALLVAPLITPTPVAAKPRFHGG